jgi:hypothetical protein
MIQLSKYQIFFFVGYLNFIPCHQALTEDARPSLNIQAFHQQLKEKDLDIIRTLFFKAANNSGDDESISQGREKAEQFLLSYPKDNTILGYLAGFRILDGRKAFWPLSKKEAIDAGLAQFDQILLNDPNNVEVRFLRGGLSFHLPFFFARHKLAVADLKSCNLAITNAPKGAFSEVFLVNASHIFNETGVLLKDN